MALIRIRKFEYAFGYIYIYFTNKKFLKKMYYAGKEIVMNDRRNKWYGIDIEQLRDYYNTVIVRIIVRI